MFQSVDSQTTNPKRNDVIARRAQGGEDRLRKFGIVMNDDDSCWHSANLLVL